MQLDIGLRLSQTFYSLFPPDGEAVIDRDWDNLLILDACRYDSFADASNLSGETTRRTGVAATTDEFVRLNFDQETHHDTVYVTGNPRVNLNTEPDRFHDVINVWEDGWDESAQTVLPETMTEAALTAAEMYSDKRLVVHYVQPHAPFVGPTAAEIPSHSTQSDHRKLARGKSADDDTENVWDLLQRGVVSRDIVIRAYEENISLVLDEVSKLTRQLQGKTAVTADHGTLLGERVPPLFSRMYGHPVGVYPTPLVELPWHVVETGSRQNITSEQPTENRTNDLEDGVVESRLKDLGYV